MSLNSWVRGQLASSHRLESLGVHCMLDFKWFLYFKCSEWLLLLDNTKLAALG